MKKTIFLLILALSVVSISQDMEDYCVVPAISGISIKPNVLLTMDFSGSMQFPAYLPCDSFSSSGGIFDCKTTTLNSTSPSRYIPTNSYYGYFDKDKCYNYAGSFFQEANCNCSDKIGSGTCISGNLLNWITTTRIDAARKVLTGGRSSSAAGNTFLESTGCKKIVNDNNLHCTFTITTTSVNTRKLRTAKYPSTGQQNCVLGNLNDLQIKIRPSDPNSIKGVIHSICDISDMNGQINEKCQAIMELMVFAGNSRLGEMKVGKTATISELISGINNEVPDSSTPTGEALYEAYDYYKQQNTYSYEANTAYIGSGNAQKDPYYDGSGGNSFPVPCRQSFVLLLSDGVWNQNVDPVIPAHKGHTQDLRTDLAGNQNFKTYAIYLFGDTDPTAGAQGNQAMKSISMFGSFSDMQLNNYPYPFVSYQESATGTCSSGQDTKRSDIKDKNNTTHCNSRTISLYNSNNILNICNPSGTYDAYCQEWDKDMNGIPDTFYYASNPEELREAILSAFSDILKQSQSSTAASIMSSSEGSGSNLFQAIFYPKKTFGTVDIDWVGELYYLFYYIDPYLQNNSIREDTDEDLILNLSNDNVIHFYFDTTESKTKANIFQDTDGDGDGDVQIGTLSLEDIKSIFEAGKLLFQRNLSLEPRRILTNISGTLTDFSVSNFTGPNSANRTLLQAQDDTEATNIINYIHGLDIAGYRNRTVTYNGITNPWRLSDIVSSTPRVESSVHLNTYHLMIPSGYIDNSYNVYINSNNYKNRGMVYVEANDGTLHAFRLGRLEFEWSGRDPEEKVRITGTDIGKEEWAFIPKNVLPYLKYLADPDYCHLFFMDMPVYIFDASINEPLSCSASHYWDCPKATSIDENKDLDLDETSWRTILIGSMGLGGACRNIGDSCADCVKTPINNVGYSSYFALDVTDPSNPVLLWEFSDPELGFSTSGPAIVRAGSPDKNGRWFVVLGSGPTGKIDTTTRIFTGKSDQNLKIFILDLKTGALLRKIDTGIINAFSGSLYNVTLDTDKWTPSSPGHYTDDVLYIGYVKKSGTTWNQGGVLRLITKDVDADNNGEIDSIDPNNWSLSKFIDDIGPVTTSIQKLQDRTNGKMWIYFGTGRFFYPTDDPGSSSDRDKIFGIKEPCYNAGTNDINPTCTTTLTFSSLNDRTTASTSEPTYGWYIQLDPPTSIDGAERVITDPLASYFGAVFFTSFAPTSDVCSMGGKTYLWAVGYNTGASIASMLQGSALIQVSTGEIKEVPLSSAFTEKSGRRTAAISGIPPKGQGLTIFLPPKPLRKYIHINER